MYFNERTPLFLQLGLREAAVAKLESYVELLWSANEELNLFSRQMTKEELIDNHVIDCLLSIQHIPQGLKKIADFGSGGGLPGVVYALQFPETTVQLYEKSPKKQAFLTRCQSLAPNLEVHGEIPKLLSGVQLVTGRAFKPLDVILEMSRDYYKNGGKYLLMKARLEKIEEEIALAQQKVKDLKVTIVPLKSPVLEVERHLLLVGFKA
jgi:16S rRNA (guanine527-N7)-methyltransferase